jgi:glycosyltransferase involved in cell wall biosynthesis
MNFKDIYVIIVLYKTSLENSKTIQTISENFGGEMNLMVFDNSPERQYSENEFLLDKFKIIYYHDGSNPGLSFAYNIALKNASLLNLKWLLLLDQDTNFTPEYFEEILELEINKLPNNVVAVLPRVISIIDNQMISPTRMTLGGFSKPISIKSGVINESISGINSGTVLSVPFMNSISGFSLNYSLDMLDHWYFRKIEQKCEKVYLLDSLIKQDLSVFGNFEENISLTRYKQLLYAESFFISEDGIISFYIFKMRLILRLLKQINYKNKSYFKLTLKEIFKTKFQNRNNLEYA